MRACTVRKFVALARRLAPITWQWSPAPWIALRPLVGDASFLSPPYPGG